ncbi:uncharacterized protein [Choristoneura fumiferana]|uniref:uncharacterized protein n=1 Tax=Choristoneura fumiferana TaxID=7141 RepID=UPI003D15C4D3
MPKETRRNSRRVEFEDSFEEAMSSSRGGGAMLHLTEELVPKFSGQDKTYPATKWIQDVEDNAEVFGWTPVQQLLMARRSLTGTAALWLRAERMYKTWDELKASLLKEFPDTIDSKTIHEMMSSRVKKSDESCIDYMLIMKELGKRGKMPDYVAIKYIIDGIRDDPMKKMMLYGVTTYSELKEKFKIYETIKEDSKTKKTPNLPNQEFRNKPKSKCYSCGENNHMSNEWPHKPKGLKCFRCNEFGHISSQCTSTAGTSKSHQRQNGGSAASHMCVNNNIPNGNKSERQNETETSFGSVKMAAMTAPQETTVANDMTDNNNVNDDGGRPTYNRYMKDPELQEEVRQVVETYRPNKTKEAPVQLRITLKDDVPVAQRPRRLALAEQQEVEQDETQAVERLKLVLVRASQYGLEINWKKAQLIQRKVEYLGHVVEDGTVQPTPEKIDAVLHGFVGLASYFRKFIQNFALIARPLTELLKKDVDFTFGEPQKAAFNILKKELIKLHTDASMYAVAAILLQRCPDDNHMHPVYYMSRKTNDARTEVHELRA